MINYNKLRKLLIDKKMNKKDLMQVSGISTASVSKLTKDQNIQTDVLCKISKALKCNFGEIMEYMRDDCNV